MIRKRFSTPQRQETSGFARNSARRQDSREPFESNRARTRRQKELNMNIVDIKRTYAFIKRCETFFVDRLLQTVVRSLVQKSSRVEKNNY
jgi:hypothetical protein